MAFIEEPPPALSSSRYRVAQLSDPEAQRFEAAHAPQKPAAGGNLQPKRLRWFSLVVILSAACTAVLWFYTSSPAPEQEGHSIAAPLSSPLVDAPSSTLEFHQRPDGWWNASKGARDHRFPPADPVYLTAAGSCIALAKQVVEPFDPGVHSPRKGLPGPHPGGAPRAAWRWDSGRITRDEFDAVPWSLVGERCIHCLYARRYKLLGGRLYEQEDLFVHLRPLPLEFGRKLWDELMNEMLLTALYLYPELPDVDFIIHFGDGCAYDMPVIQWNICKDRPLAGFTMPTYSVWMNSLGREGHWALQTCYSTRYPLEGRRPSVWWRGSSTNHLFKAKLGKPITVDNVFEVPRVRLHNLTRDEGPEIDVRLNNLVELKRTWKGWLWPHEPELSDAAVRAAVGDMSAELVPFEDFNRNAIILDIDGNAWSDRFGQLMHFNTPVLKQRSNFSAFFEHLVAPGALIESYSYDLSDVVPRARAVIREYVRDPSRLVRMAERRQGLAALLLSDIAQAEALAYTLQTYASLIDWTPVEERGYRLVVPEDNCCKYSRLPAEMVRGIQRMGARWKE